MRWIAPIRPAAMSWRTTWLPLAKRRWWQTVSWPPVVSASLALSAAEPSVAQKSGGVLRVHHWDSPASMSIHEEATYSTVVPMANLRSAR